MSESLPKRTRWNLNYVRPNRRHPHSICNSSPNCSPIERPLPRNRNGKFEPQLIAKHQRRWNGFDETILALYERRITTRDAQGFLREMYDIEASPEFISSVCESLGASVQE